MLHIGERLQLAHVPALRGWTRPTARDRRSGPPARARGMRSPRRGRCRSRRSVSRRRCSDSHRTTRRDGVGPGAQAFGITRSAAAVAAARKVDARARQSLPPPACRPLPPAAVGAHVLPAKRRAHDDGHLARRRLRMVKDREDRLVSVVDVDGLGRGRRLVHTTERIGSLGPTEARSTCAIARVHTCR